MNDKTLKRLLNKLYPFPNNRIYLSTPKGKPRFKEWLITNKLDLAYFLLNTKSHLFNARLYKSKLSRQNKRDKESVLFLKQGHVGRNQWMVIKTLTSIPYFTHDIDILVKNKKSLNYLKKQQRKALSVPTGLDINYQISWTGKPEINNDYAFSNSVVLKKYGTSILVPNHKLDFLIRVGHLPFEQAQLSLFEALYLFKLYTKLSKLDKTDIFKEVVKNHWSQTYIRTLKLLSELHFDLFHEPLDPEYQIPKTYKYNQISWPYRLSYIALFKAVLEKKAWHKVMGARYLIKDRLIHSLIKPKNKLIVLCGVDGVGKTTLAKKLQIYLKTTGIDAIYHHGHSYRVSQSSFGIGDEFLWKYKKLLQLLLPMALLDNWWTYVFKYRHDLKNSILISDRYFYDKLARLMHYGICNYQLASVYLKLLPKPDYIFILDAKTKDILVRKREWSQKDINEYKAFYKYFAQKLNVPIIDTSSSIKQSLNEIKNQISF